MTPDRERWWDGGGWTQFVRPGAGTLASRPDAEAAPPSGTSPAMPRTGDASVPARPYAPAAATAVPTTADGIGLASWGRRAAAAVLDNLLVSLLAVVVLQVAVHDFYARWQAAAQEYVTTLFTNPGVVPGGEFVHLANLVGLTTGIGTLVYSAVMILALKATAGQRALGIRICPADHGTATMPWPQGLLRCVVWTFVTASGSSLVALVQLANIVWPLFHKRRQSLVDLVCRTQVVRTR